MKFSGLSMLLILATLSSSSAVPHDPMGLMTGGLNNGRFWKILDQINEPRTRPSYLSGFSDALAFIYQRLENEKNLEGSKEMETFLEQLDFDGSTNDMVAHLDSFYRDPANVQIPLPFAFEYCVMRTKGASAKELEDLLAQFRRDAE
jgi:hypothetical protein